MVMALVAATAALLPAPAGAVSRALPSISVPTLPTVGELCRPRPGMPVQGVSFCNMRVAGRPDAVPPFSATPVGYSPADVQSMYHIPRTTHHQRVAIVGAGTFSNVDADLAVYRKTFKLPACRTSNGCFRIYKVAAPDAQSRALDVATAGLRTDNTLETALDLDAVSAMCPECPIDLINADGNATTSQQAAIAYATHTLHDIVVSFSYSSGEGSAANRKSDDQVIAYDAPLHTVLFNSSGDSGGGGEATAPGANPRVVSVGGTSVTRNSRKQWQTIAWSGTTTGCSQEYPRPSWQSTSHTGCRGRAETDVSALADPNTGIATYVTLHGAGGWLEAGGTSLATPLVAAMTARLGRGRAVTPQTFYRRKWALLDVIRGSSAGSGGSCGGDAMQVCTARKGWDGPTGNGTPRNRRVFG